MIRRKKQIVILSIVLAVVLLSISVAYAALSATLTVTTNKITQNPMVWDIGFVQGTVTGVVRVDNSNDVICGDATATLTSITGISASLGGTGDECAYTFTIRNNGTIAGMISLITITKPQSTACTITGSTMVCGDITYKLHYDNATSSSLVTVGDQINPKSGSTPTTKTVVLTITHTGTSPAEVDYRQTGFAYRLAFSQH